MDRHLYFVCPTDFLEPVINQTFKQENYYLTSIGNSITFDSEMVSEVTELLQAKNIRDVSFVLSDNNHFVSEVLKKKDFSGIVGLSDFYHQIASQKEHSKKVWQSRDHQFLISSYYLSQKITELRFKLTSVPVNQLRISAKIYQRKDHLFCDVFPSMISKDYSHLN